MFVLIEDAYAILRSKGVFKQVKVYERDGRIFVAYGSGYISVNHLNGTSVHTVIVDEIILPFIAERNRVGFLVNPETYEGETISIKGAK